MLSISLRALGFQRHENRGPQPSPATKSDHRFQPGKSCASRLKVGLPTVNKIIDFAQHAERVIRRVGDRLSAAQPQKAANHAARFSALLFCLAAA
jgi:hypothetical protein